jgi:predicted O-methyltransferase YrrM
MVLKNSTYIFICVIIIVTLIARKKYPRIGFDTTITKCLNGRILPDYSRYETMGEAMKFMTDRSAHVIVETGTARNGDANCKYDGCSTVIFGEFANLTRKRLYSVDVNCTHCQKSREAVDKFKPAVQVICNDSIQFLSNFKDKIDYLYLDSFDFDELNPDPSQQHHLKEIKAAYNKLHDDSIVMIDDCQLPHRGKCKLVAEFLLDRGWKRVRTSYQEIFSYRDFHKAKNKLSHNATFSKSTEAQKLPTLKLIKQYFI